MCSFIVFNRQLGRKILTQNFFSAKSIYKCVIDDESYFTVDDNEWQQQSYYQSDDHPATEDVTFIRKTKFPAKVLLWLVVSESGISKPQGRTGTHIDIA
jgi:hypothetical protein